jgi:hypothetical protein
MKSTCLFSFFLVSLIVLFSACEKTNNVNNPPIVDAGVSQTIVWPVDSVVLSGSAQNADGVFAGFLWSQISGPKGSVIVDPGSATTLVRFSAIGKYIFQLLVVDTTGITGIDTVSVVVSPATIDSLILTADAQGYYDLTFFGNADTNYTDPTSPELNAMAWLGGTDTLTNIDTLNLMRAALFFNFSALPADITIVSAQLNLFSNPKPIYGNQTDANEGSDNAIIIQAITDPWDMNADWFSQPAATTLNQVSVPHTGLASFDLVGVDVTALVSGMLSGTNHGFMIKLQSETGNNTRFFCGSRYPDTSKHPSLKVFYTRN